MFALTISSPDVKKINVLGASLSFVNIEMFYLVGESQGYYTVYGIQCHICYLLRVTLNSLEA